MNPEEPKPPEPPVSVPPEPLMQCCNPHGDVHPGEVVTVSVRKISVKDVEKNPKLVVNNWWCDRCRKKKIIPAKKRTSSSSLESGPSKRGNFPGENLIVSIEDMGCSSALGPKATSHTVESSEGGNFERSCCDPYKIHPNVIVTSEHVLRRISATAVLKDPVLIENKYWCDTCRKHKLKKIVPSAPPPLIIGPRKKGKPVGALQPIPEEKLEEAIQGIDCSSISLPSQGGQTVNPSVKVEFCYNPFGFTNHVVSNGLRKVSSSDVANNPILISGRNWCTKCRKHNPAKPDYSLCHFKPTETDLCTGTISSVSDLSSDERKTLAWTSGNWSISSTAKICERHYKRFIGTYKEVEPKVTTECCNPLGIHKKQHGPVTDNLKPVSLLTAVRARARHVFLVCGESCCTQCKDDVLNMPVQEAAFEVGAGSSVESHDSGENLKSRSESNVSSADVSPSVHRSPANQLMATLGQSPLKDSTRSVTARVQYAKRKLEESLQEVCKKICKPLDVPSEDVMKEFNQKSSELDLLMVDIKERLITASRLEKYQLLGLCPLSISINDGARYFGVSNTLFAAARKQRVEHGLLSTPVFKRTPTVSERVKKLIIDFYCDDRYSKVQPGIRDSVSIEHGKRREQKRLILCNLRELYELFKKEHQLEKLPSFSYFCSLRPKWCITADSAGVHSVCVCQTHQDIKLLLHSLGIQEHYRDIIKTFVCDDTNRECMLRLCEKCPRKEHFQKVLEEKVLQSKFECSPELIEDELKKLYLENKIQYRQWKSTDRAELLEMSASRSDIIEQAASQFLKLIPHDFIARRQAQHLKNERENLSPQKALIFMDFSMNYSCLIQEEIQSYHWSKKQATVHPVFIYYKDEGGTETKYRSLCYISDDLDHDVHLVRAIQDHVINYIKENMPQVKEVEYFTDGCAQQYKNKRSFMYLCTHEKRYGLKASHSFFATSHGKSPCDAIGGVLKRMARYASLQRPRDKQIISAQHLFEFCKTSDMEIQCFFIAKADVNQIRELTSNERKPISIPGTRSYHSFTPLTEDIVACKRTSFDEVFLQHCLYQETKCIDFDVGDFVFVKEARKKYIAYVSDYDDEGEVDLAVMYPAWPASKFYYSEDIISFILPVTQVLAKVNLLELPNNFYVLDEASKNLLKPFLPKKKKNT